MLIKRQALACAGNAFLLGVDESGKAFEEVLRTLAKRKPKTNGNN